MAVAEEYQAVEEASRRKSQADNQQSNERLSAPWPGTVLRCCLVFITSGLPCVQKRYLSTLPSVDQCPNRVVWKPLAIQSRKVELFTPCSQQVIGNI